MTSRHLVDPALASLMKAPSLDVTRETLPAFRRALRGTFAASLGAGDPEVAVSQHLAPGREGAPGVPLHVYTPPGAAAGRPALLHMHGGGYVLGSAAMMGALNQARARALDCVVVSVDYRLAPETPYPGPVEDCHAALVWLADHAAALGIDPGRIAVGGESAGGGLAAALCLLCRDRGGPAVAFQFLIYPMLDHRTATPADPLPNAFAGEFAWTPAGNRFGWAALLGDIDPSGEVPAYCSPTRAPDVAGLPPTFLAVGALDLFVDEGVDYAARLIRAGVPTELHVYPGAFHGFDVVATAPVAIQFHQDCTRALQRAFR
jgi:acetyl esterase/lipase